VLSFGSDKFSSFLCFAGKMKDLGAPVNEANKKVTAKKRRKNAQSLEHLITGSGLGLTSSLVVDLEGDGPSEELVQEPAKRKKVGTPSKEPITPIRVVRVRSERGTFFSSRKCGLSRINATLIRPFSWMTLR